jgi:hypothetical protein
MFFFKARIDSDSGSGISNSQRHPGKGGEGQDLRFWEFYHPREAGAKREKSQDGCEFDDFREASFDLQAKRNIAEGSESGKSNRRRHRNSMNLGDTLLGSFIPIGKKEKKRDVPEIKKFSSIL